MIQLEFLLLFIVICLHLGTSEPGICSPGKFGWKCKFLCACQTGSCDQTTGSCETGCRKGKYGIGCLLDSKCFYDTKGINYTGNVDVTKDGQKCIRWMNDSVQREGYTRDRFPPGDDPGQHCRNPESRNGYYGAKPWCFTATTGKKTFAMCDIKECVCPDGLFGPSCSYVCHCRNVDEVCHSVTGTCKSGCANGWTGISCQKRCQPGKYGHHCQQECRHCYQNLCDPETGNCTNGCEPGYKGLNCSMECQNDYYGWNCEERCGHCREETCKPKTGICFRGCSDGYTGDRCVEKCPAGRYGYKCREYCGYCKLGTTCDHVTGKCVNGCVAGKMGDTCKEGCPDFFYGENCTIACGKCKDGLPCLKTTGQCMDGCTEGYYGKGCLKECPKGVYSGNCTSVCGTCNDRVMCPSSTGQCIDECTDGCVQDESDDTMLKSVGIVLSCVVVAGTIFLLAVLVWRRRKRLEASECNGPLSGMSYQNNTTESNEDTSTKYHINPTYGLARDDELELVNYCNELQDVDSSLDMDYVKTEFYKLPRSDIKLTNCGSLEENTNKNAYIDILPFDETRVVLQTEGREESDYINASYINGYRNIIRYVAAQGPTLETIYDFWRMIWELKTTKIVMLTNLVESGEMKCEMYWPHCSSEYQSYGKVCVQCVEEKVYQFYTLRTLAVWKGKSETRTVRQFHFTAWPDRGVPEETESVIAFHRVVKDTGPNGLGPMVVHCSAGVGRSGTFIALDYLLDQARYEGSLCIYKCIQEFRFQRMKMVQTKKQYKFVYDMLASSLQYIGTLPQYYSPVLFQCYECWNKRNKAESQDEVTSLEENNQEYQPLWNCGLENREDFLPDTSTSPPDVCAIISEDSPPLVLTPIQVDEDSDHYESIAVHRMSIDTEV